MPFDSTSINAPISPYLPEGQSDFDYTKFLKDRRIHLDHSSIIEPYGAYHPGELDPAHEPKLRAKLEKNLSLTPPRFFDDKTHGEIATKLGGLIPMSLAAEEDIHARRGRDLESYRQSGQNPQAAHALAKDENPYASLIEALRRSSQPHPYEKEQADNAIAMYLIVEAALQKPETPQTARFTGALTSIMRYKDKAENVLVNLHALNDILPGDIIEIARRSPAQGGGIAGVGRALGLSDNEITEIMDVTQHASAHHYSNNIIENWKAGRTNAPIADYGLDTTLRVGLQSRVEKKITELRDKVGHHYETSSLAKAHEEEFLGALRMLPPVVAEALYELGTEFCYTKEAGLKHMLPDSKALGLHRTLRNTPGEEDGTRMIFVSEAQGSKINFVRTAIHEAFHLLFPKSFSPEQAQAVDGLYKHDEKRLSELKGVVDAYWRGELSEHDTRAKLRSDFTIGGLSIDDAIGPNGDLKPLYWLVNDAYQNLNTESPNYAKMGYPTPELKTYEIMSRYSEVRYVQLHDNPRLTAWLTPGITEVHDTYYIPHIRDKLAELKAEKTQATSPANDTPPSTQISGTSHYGMLEARLQQQAI